MKKKKRREKKRPEKLSGARESSEGLVYAL
jgi:hypothetical protein